MYLPVVLTRRHTEYREAIKDENTDRVSVDHPGYRYEWCRRGGHAFLCAYGVPADCIVDCGDPHCGKVTT